MVPPLLYSMCSFTSEEFNDLRTTTRDSAEYISYVTRSLDKSMPEIRIYLETLESRVHLCESWK